MLRRYVYIFHEAALGDFLMTWPLVLGAARVWPQMRVVVVTAGGKGRLASEVLKVEHDDAEAWAGLFRQTPDLDEKRAKRLGMAHAVLSFVGTDEWRTNVAALTGGVEPVMLKGRPGEGEDTPVSEFILGQVEDAALREAGRSVLNYVRTNGLGGGSAEGPVVAHVGSGSAAKNWPAGHFEALRDAVPGLRLVGGEAEADREGVGGVEVFEDLAGLLAAVRGASAFVGHDTGPTHLAAMLGVPTLALRGEAASAAWRPVGPRVRELPLGASAAEVAGALSDIPNWRMR